MSRVLFLLLTLSLFSAGLYAEEFDPAALPAVKKALDKATAEVARNRKAYDEANQKAFNEAKEAISKEVDRLSKAGKLEEAVAVKKFSESLGRQVLAKAEKAAAPPHPAIKGAVAWNGHKYKYFADKVTWPDAKAKCEEMGGHLVIIDNQAENDFVLAALKGIGIHSGEIWLGISRDRSSGLWTSVAGNTPRFTNWCRGEPSNDGPFVCLWVHERGTWNDCTEKFETPFICEWDD